MSICRILYSGKPSREKTSANSRRKLSSSLLAHQRMPHPQIHGKTFANSHKIVKFTKVFSLESFLLYGTLMQQDTRTGSLVWSTLSEDLSLSTRTGSLVWSTWSQDLSIGTGSLKTKVSDTNCGWYCL